MGGLNHPDLATRAGEEPLPQSDESDLDGGQMDTDVEEISNEDHANSVHLTGNIVQLGEVDTDSNKTQPSGTEEENRRPARPTVLTSNHTSSLTDKVSLESPYRRCSQDPNSTPSVDHGRSSGSGAPSARSPSRSLSSKDDSDSVAISPMLRRFTIPNSERSPTETLPAMHTSPASTSSRSPNGQQNLPSLRAIALEPLLDTRSASEIAPHGIARPPFSMGSGTLNSPPVNSMPARSGQHYSTQSRMNGHFSPHQTSEHTSPSSYDTSPSTTMSPPSGKPTHQGFQSSARTPHSEDSTPQSAESHNSSSSFSTAPSPNNYNLETDRSRPTLPPLAGLTSGPVMTGSFKCNHAGCTAAPFQTQYLLK